MPGGSTHGCRSLTSKLPKNTEPLSLLEPCLTSPQLCRPCCLPGRAALPETSRGREEGLKGKGQLEMQKRPTLARHVVSPAMRTCWDCHAHSKHKHCSPRNLTTLITVGWILHQGKHKVSHTISSAMGFIQLKKERVEKPTWQLMAKGLECPHLCSHGSGAAGQVP